MEGSNETTPTAGGAVTLSDFGGGEDDDDDFGLDLRNKSLSLSPHNTTTDGIHAEGGGGSGVDGDNTPTSDTWKFVGVGQEETTPVDSGDSPTSPLPMLPTGLTSMSLT